MSNDTPPAKPVYATRAGDVAGDRDTVIAVWQGNLGSASGHAAKFDWFYRACPYGQPLVQLLYHEPSSACIGTCAAGPRRMLHQGREIRAGVLVDMAVEAQHRTLGPAMILQAALMAAASGRFDLLYGFPNRKSLPVVKRLGYNVLGYLPRFTRVLYYRGYLQRIVPPWLVPPLALLLDGFSATSDLLHAQFRTTLRSEWCERADQRMDDLWSRSRHGDEPITIRDTAFLRWRFDEAPGIRTRYLTLSEPDDTLCAWFACQAEGGTLHVRDFWSLEAATGIRSSHIHALLRAARRGGYSAVSVEYAGTPASLAGWMATGFHERSQRPVIGLWLGAGHETSQPATFHLTAADEDE